MSRRGSVLGLGLLFLVLIFSYQDSQCQENIGIEQDNYAPVNSRFLNPSSIVDAGTWLDINLVGVSAYVRNNFAFLPDAYLLNPETYQDPIVKEPNQNLYAYSSDMVLGPSASLVIHQHSISFHSAARSYVFSRNLPKETAAFIEDSITLEVADGIYNADRLRVKELTWEEYGLTYGRILQRKDNNMITGAITVNRLLGFHSAGMYMRSADLEVDNQNGSFINIEDGNYWYNEPARLSGRGWSGSLGMTFKKMKKDISNYVPHSVFGSCQFPEYKYKLGLSLLDIGAIRFDRGALYNNFDEDTPIDSLKNWTEITERALAEADGFEYMTWLPMALSIQYDHNFNDYVYGHLALIQRLSLPSFRGAERANLLSASLRFETKKFSVAVPLSLHEYRYPQLGLNLRLWFLVLGTDQILPFFRKQDLYAADVYAYIKIPIFVSPECRFKKNKDKKGRGHYKKYMCPAW